MTTLETIQYAALSFLWSVPHLAMWTLAAAAAMLLLRQRPFVVLALAAGAAVAWTSAVFNVGVSALTGPLWGTMDYAVLEAVWRVVGLVSAAGAALQWLFALVAVFGWRGEPTDEDASSPASA